MSEQLALIESNNPDIASSNPALASSETDKLIESHTTVVQNIESMGDDRQEQIESLITQNEQTIKAIDEQLRQVEAELAEAPSDPRIIDDQAKLNQFKEYLENEQGLLAEEMKGLDLLTKFFFQSKG